MTSRIRNITLSGALVLALVAGVACGGSDSKATAQKAAVEQAIEAAGEGPGGEGPGDYSIKTEDGSMTVTSGGALPDGFPSEVVIPARWTQITVSELSTADTKMYSVGFTVSDDIDTAVAEFTAPLERNGFEEVGSMLSSEPGSEGAVITWQNAQWSVSMVMGTYDGDISVAVSVTSV
ncbi:MAG TPA: hypothetical protein PLP26_10995 [Ilumatobacteraceae bacterium]|nr:hypothetical protein [Ilumatobacteraceae bacterium]